MLHNLTVTTSVTLLWICFKCFIISLWRLQCRIPIFIEQLNRPFITRIIVAHFGEQPFGIWCILNCEFTACYSYTHVPSLPTDTNLIPHSSSLNLEASGDTLLSDGLCVCVCICIRGEQMMEEKTLCVCVCVRACVCVCVCVGVCDRRQVIQD